MLVLHGKHSDIKIHDRLIRWPLHDYPRRWNPGKHEHRSLHNVSNYLRLYQKQQTQKILHRLE